MKREWLTGGALVLGACFCTTAALAQPEAGLDCPPGAYCQSEDVGPPAQDGAGDEGPPTAVEVEEPAGETVSVIRGNDGAATVELPPVERGGDPTAPRTFTYVPPRNGRPGQVIVYEDGSTAPQLPPGDDIAPPPATQLVRKRKVRERHRRWGIMARVNGALLPQYRADIEDYGMVGVGVSLRYRPKPAFALDFGADFMGGVDSNGLERRELPVHASAMFYPNPNDFAQFYVFGGVNGALAHVSSEEFQDHLADGTSDDYSYVGVHAGGGVELRLTPVIGIALDAQLYARTRTDDDSSGRFAEFNDPISGDKSNTSLGGLARAGVNFWW